MKHYSLLHTLLRGGGGGAVWWKRPGLGPRNDVLISPLEKWSPCVVVRG